jgi:hypothetical protein
MALHLSSVQEVYVTALKPAVIMDAVSRIERNLAFIGAVFAIFLELKDSSIPLKSKWRS